MKLFKKAQEEGLPLKRTYLVMLAFSIGISALLLLMANRTIASFQALSGATDRYIELDQATNALLSASDYLTEEVQCYTVVGDRVHLDNYFAEAEQMRRRDKAVATMEEQLPASRALEELKDAMGESVSLMEREFYAMRLMLEAAGDTDIPETLRGVELTAEDRRLSAAEKKALAERMVHDEEYCTRKNTIRTHLDECLEELKSGTHGTQADMEARMRRDLLWVIALIIVQSAMILVTLWLTTSLGINPLLRAVDHIKRDQRLPIMGAHEFRYLADTYNKMYLAYKRSIENLSFKASHDELTGVYNRAGYDLIKESVDLSSTAFLLFDADRFKQINDQNGHQVGDLVLKKVAAALRRNFRSDDYICRIGGDEFVVLMVHVDQSVRGLIDYKVNRINEELEKDDDGTPAISVSAGVSLCSKKGSIQEMFHEADIALYHVKDNGRKGCCFYEDRMEEKRRKPARG